MLTGKKTYVAVIAGFIASVALFVQAGDYSISSILHLVQGDAVLAAVAALRLALAKKA